MSGLPRFDPATFERLREMVGQGTLDRIVGLFREQVPRILAVVRDGVESGELREATRFLHSLRSSAGMLGATEVEVLAGEMEPLARDGRGARLGALVEELEAALERAVSEVSQRLASGY